MVRVEISNFQSIAHQVIELDNFSAIVGRSNIGKSAVVRAIKAALSGSPVDSYVRHGLDCQRAVKGSKSCKCSCSVKITSEDFDLLWEKGDSINRYVFNGEEHTVAGRGTPEFLGESFQPVKLGDEKKLLQVSDQFDPIFILNKSGTVVADVLSDVAKLDQINAAIRLANKDKKSCAATRKVREKDVIDLKETLSRYDGLDDVLEKVSSVESLEKQIESLERKIDRLNKFMAVVKGAATRVKTLEGVGDVGIPEFDPLSKMAVRFKEASNLLLELNSKQKSLQSLEGVDQISLPDMERFESVGTKYRKLDKRAIQLKAFKVFFEKAKAANSVEIPDISHVGNQLDKFRGLGSWVNKLKTTEKDLDQVVNKFEKISLEEKALNCKFKELGVCPTCSRSLSDDHGEIHA